MYFCLCVILLPFSFFFFFNDTATTEIYTLSLHDALPISDLAEYQDHHFRRLGAKPGITGLWQVRGRSSVTDFEEVVRLDRDYIERWSPWLDLEIDRKSTRLKLQSLAYLVCRLLLEKKNRSH